MHEEDGATRTLMEEQEEWSNDKANVIRIRMQFAYTPALATFSWALCQLSSDLQYYALHVPAQPGSQSQLYYSDLS